MIVAHLDLDAFYAAVEELEDPSLRRVPLVVGGNPRGRGVVSTANYLAREFGIHSAMSCAEAMRRCPHAVFVTPRHSVYRAYSRAVWDAVRHVVPTVERTGLDEGYLAIGEVAPDFLAARRIAEAVQAAVRGATSLSASLGVASCKVVAKVASDWRKPSGLTVVPAGREAAFLAPFDVRRLPGVGPRSEERLRGRSRRRCAIPTSPSAAARRRWRRVSTMQRRSATSRASSSTGRSATERDPFVSSESGSPISNPSASSRLRPSGRG